MSENHDELPGTPSIIDIERRQDEVLQALDQLEQRIAALLVEFSSEGALPKAA